MVIMTKECVDTVMDTSVRKVEILQRKEPMAPRMRNNSGGDLVMAAII